MSNRYDDSIDDQIDQVNQDNLSNQNDQKTNSNRKKDINSKKNINQKMNTNQKTKSNEQDFFVVDQNLRRFRFVNVKYSTLFSKKRVQPKKKSPSKEKKKVKNLSFLIEYFQKPLNDFDETNSNFIRNKNQNKIAYNKTSYSRDAMAIFLINNIFFNESTFREIESENIATAKILYQLMSKTKKKVFIKTIFEILNLNNDKFIGQTRRYFLTWLNKFQYESSKTLKDQQFALRKITAKTTIFKRFSIKRFSKDEVRKKYKKIKHSKFRFSDLNSEAKEKDREENDMKNSFSIYKLIQRPFFI